MNNKPVTNIYNNKRKIYLFCRDKNGKLFIEEDNSFFPYFYERDEIDGKFQAYTGEKLRKIFVSNPSDVSKKRSDNAMEADIIFTRRYMIDKIDKLEKCLIKYAFIDIEVLADELPNPKEAKQPISCISVYNSLYKSVKTFYLPDYETEYKLIEHFINYMKKEKFDLWLSWNVKFDYNYLVGRYPDFAEKVSIIGKSRYGDGDVFYPAGISIIDYLLWFKKITLNREQSYALDNIAQVHLKEQSFEKINFASLNPKIKEKNINDVKRMQKLEEKFKLISYFDEIRRLTKVDWEDMIWNSRILDILLLQEAKKQKVILPMKPDEMRGTLEEKADYLGAYREAIDTGRFFNIGKYDLSSAYPMAIIDFCLDPSNIINIVEACKQTPKVEINNTNFYQNPNALLPTVVRKLINLKNEIKTKLESIPLDTPEYKDTKLMYKAIKSVVNSAYGVFGNRFFRLYNKNVASATTFIVRSLLHYVQEKLELKGYKVIYVDTDSVFIDSKENLNELCNELVQQWGKEVFGKDKVEIEFGYEGLYEKLLILTKCRYKGWLRTKKGLEVETKGIEAKRKDSTIFMKKFQTELIDKIVNKIPKEEIFKWIEQSMSDIKSAPLNNISFPCKLARKPEDYKNVPIFLRALNNSDLKKRIGEPFYYLFVKPDGYETKIVEKVLIQTYNKDEVEEKGFKNYTVKRLITACKFNFGSEFTTEDEEQRMRDQLREQGILKNDSIEIKGKAKDVIAFDESNLEGLKDKVDWQRMIERNITMKLVTIFEAMKWDINNVTLNQIEKVEIKPNKETKDEVEEYIKKMKKENKCEHGVKGSTLGFQPKSDGSSPSVRSNYERIQEEKSKVKMIKNFELKDLKMRKLDFKEAKKYIKENHYSHTIASSVKLGLGFYYKDELVTAIVYGCPIGRRVTQWLKVERENCVELIRLYSKDGLPPNTESYCIGQSFKYIKENTPHLKYLISYADPNHGHVGYIYQATNWMYVGVQRRLLPERRIFIDGKETHTRTLNARHGSTSKKKLEEIYGDRLEIKSALKKHVYLMCLGNKKERREWYKKFPDTPYPKIKEVINE